MPLTDDARKELREAVRIVREDKFEAFVRSRVPKNDPPNDPPKDPLLDPPKNDPEPPPPKDPPTDPPTDPPKGRKSAWWGELIDD